MSMADRSQPRSPSPGWVWPLLLLVLGAVVVWRFWPHGGSGLDPNAVPRPVMARGDLAADEKSTIELFRQASPSVVHITRIAVQRDAFSFDLREVPEGTGSGFIWDEQGHVVTNYHVIQGTRTAQVTLSDNSTYKGRVIGAYPDKDLAVLKIDAPPHLLRPIPIGTSHDLQVGQKAFAIGNPFGLDQTLTTGVISAVGREIESVTERTIKGVIQTDAAINPGNSGGPLLDSAGRLIGVNTAIVSPSRASAGIGFAIPVDEVNRVVPQLIRRGKVTRPGLGVQVAEDQQAQWLQLRGVLILGVVPQGPADKAGLRPTRRTAIGEIRLGDVIVAIDGKPTQSTKDLFGVLEQHKVGDTVTVTILRDGQRHDVEVTLDDVS